MRDSLLQIANMCPNFSLFDVISDLDSIEVILKNPSPTIYQLFNTCFVETKSTRFIRKLDWPADQGLSTTNFFQSSCVVTDDSCVNEINKLEPESTVVNQVKVHKLNLVWLFRNYGNYLKLVQILNDSQQNNEIFATDFVCILLGQYWTKYQKRLFFRLFIPFQIYLFFSIMFIYICLYNSVHP